MAPSRHPCAHARSVRVRASLAACLLSLAWPALPLARPLAGQEEERVAVVRELYGRVQAGLEAYEVEAKEYRRMPGSGTVTIHREGDALRKMTVTFEADGLDRRTEYFFWDDAIFFVFEREENYPLPEWGEVDPADYGPREDRYYFDGETIVRWLVRDHRDGMETRRMTPGTEDYVEREKGIWEGAWIWLDFAASEVDDFEVFMEGYVHD